MARCEPSPLAPPPLPLPRMFSLKVSSLRTVSSPRSPKAMMSTETLIFLRRLASLIRVFSSSAMGEHVKTMMRWRWDLFWRCLRASYNYERYS